MKNNQPIVDSEIHVPPEEILVSRTDRRGIITYVNSSFAEVSGYAIEKLIGTSHNIVRHPDVPAAIYEDLWQTIQRGDPWHGIVMNRSKCGRHYWVDALVTPTFQGDEIVGYASVRRRPTMRQVALAERRYDAIRHGWPVRPWWERSGLYKLVSIRNGLVLGILAVLAFFLLAMTDNVASQRQAQREYEVMYHQQVDGSGVLRQIKFLMGENHAQLLQALLHDPHNPISSQHDHPLELHLQSVEQHRSQIEQLWLRFMALPMNADLRTLAASYRQGYLRYLGDGLNPAIGLLGARADYLQAHRVVVGPLQKTYQQANTQADALIDYMQQVAERRHTALQVGHERYEGRMYLAIFAVVAGLSLAAFLFFRSIMRPLEDSIDALSSLARGDLSRHPELRGMGETRRLMGALAISQSQLHAILDQLSQNASTLSGKSALLNYLVRHIADGTDEQHERIHLVSSKLEDTGAAMAALSEQAEALSNTTEASRAALAAAEQDSQDSLVRMRGLMDTLRQLHQQAGSVVAACRSELDQPPADGSSAAPDRIAGMRRHLERMESFLTTLSASLGDEQPVLQGLNAATGNDWNTLHEINLRLGDMTRDLAIATRMQFFAFEDLQGDMRVVADFLVNNRGASHEIWAASSQVMELANDLEELTGRFTLSGEPPDTSGKPAEAGRGAGA
jgi:aerotaxis receptor